MLTWRLLSRHHRFLSIVIGRVIVGGGRLSSRESCEFEASVKLRDGWSTVRGKNDTRGMEQIGASLYLSRNSYY